MKKSIPSKNIAQVKAKPIPKATKAAKAPSSGSLSPQVEEEEKKTQINQKSKPSKNLSSSKPVPMNRMQKPTKKVDSPINNEPLSSAEEPFQVKANEDVATTEGSDPINVQLKIALKPVSLTPTRSQEIPCLVEISSPESLTTKRSGIDIVCVIDVSGSMSGDKLELVKKTLLFMIKRLDITDRVSILTFSDDAKLKSGLICMNDSGKEKVSTVINRMNIEGGTEIIKGLELSFQVISKRLNPNQITSVILLSDGVDNNGDSALNRFNSIFKQYSDKISTGFVIHTFGYGSDHQADLMNAIASKTNGGFYYVEQEKLIPQAFSDCLGEMMSVVADSVNIELCTLPAGIPFSLTKVYSETGDLSFRMPPILSGDKKEAVFILNFLQTDIIVPQGSFETPIKARVQFKLTATGEVKSIEAFLRVQVVNESENIEVELDEDVMVNFYRVKCADIMKEAANFGDRNQLQQARDLLSAAVQEFKSCVVASHPTVQILISDLETSIPRFADRQVYEYGGKASMKSKFNSHQNKRGVYKNKRQQVLLEEAEEEFN